MSSKNDKAARIAPPSQRSVEPKRVDVVLIQASKRIIVFACGLLCLLILGAAFAGFSLGTSTGLAPKGSGTAVRSPGQSLILSGSTGAYQLKPGPWGDIEGQRTVIEIPDEFLSTRLHEADVPRWFSNITARQRCPTFSMAPALPPEKSANCSMPRNGKFQRPELP
jgi:hypothetical protein